MLPIYDVCIKNLPKGELSEAARDHLISEFDTCTPLEVEVIYGLILSYCQAESLPLVHYPFKAKQTLEGIEFRLDTLPNKLQQVINKFVCKIRNK